MNSNKVLNTSFLSGSHFTFNIPDFTDLEFNIQNANLPGVTSQAIVTPVAAGYMKSSGEHLSYNNLKISFINDESLNCWSSIYNWMRAASPDNFSDSGNNQYKKFVEQYGSIYKDATMFILTNSLNVNIIVNFKNIFPTYLSDLDFSVTDIEDRKIVSDVYFEYSHYEIDFNDEYNAGSNSNNHITF